MPEYESFARLAGEQRRNLSYQVVASARPSPVLILAPHGGGIEPGTSELARAIACDSYSYYCFEGTKHSGNAGLHIASHFFDEPVALAMVQPADVVLALHGCAYTGERVYIGGLDERLGEAIGRHLGAADIKIEPCPPDELAGRSRRNICNRGRTGQGCQLEVTEDLRKTLFENLSRQGRQRRYNRFEVVACAIRSALAEVVLARRLQEIS